MAGGINDKQARSAAIWRQGNLMHFSFAELPDQLNDLGVEHFVNSIRYISQFTEDRPIAHTPSVFKQRIVHCREVSAFELSQLVESSSSQLELVLHPADLADLTSRPTRSDKLTWIQDHKRFSGKAEGNVIQVDRVLMELGKEFSEIGTIEYWIERLDAPESQEVANARQFLAQYVACGPSDSWDRSEWAIWLKENKDYLFASENGDYQWYIDPLAKKRRMPLKHFIGEKRMGIAEPVR